MKHCSALLTMLLGFVGFHPCFHDTTLLAISVAMEKIDFFLMLSMISINFVHVLIGKNYFEAKLIDRYI